MGLRQGRTDFSTPYGPGYYTVRLEPNSVRNLGSPHYFLDMHINVLGVDVQGDDFINDGNGNSRITSKMNQLKSRASGIFSRKQEEEKAKQIAAQEAEAAAEAEKQKTLQLAIGKSLDTVNDVSSRESSTASGAVATVAGAASEGLQVGIGIAEKSLDAVTNEQAETRKILGLTTNQLLTGAGALILFFVLANR